MSSLKPVSTVSQPPAYLQNHSRENQQVADAVETIDAIATSALNLGNQTSQEGIKPTHKEGFDEIFSRYQKLREKDQGIADNFLLNYVNTDSILILDYFSPHNFEGFINRQGDKIQTLNLKGHPEGEIWIDPSSEKFSKRDWELMITRIKDLNDEELDDFMEAMSSHHSRGNIESQGNHHKPKLKEGGWLDIFGEKFREKCPNLISLKIDSEDFSSLYIDSLPQKLEILEIHSQEFNVSVDELPRNLTSFTIDSTNFNRSVDNLPPKLKFLKIHSKGFKRSLDTLPPNLETLDLECDEFDRPLKKLPPKLKSISLHTFWGVPRGEFTLPPRLESLEVKTCLTTQCVDRDNLPSTLKNLVIDGKQYL